MTDLPVFTGTFNGTEVFEVVAAPTGQTNPAAGVNYQITSALLAALLSNLGQTAVIITNGQYTSPASPYVPPIGVSRIYVSKTNVEATYIQFDLASSYLVEPLVKEIAGSAAPAITVTFTNAESADGNTSVPIQTPYGGYFFRPVSSLSTWTLGSA
jgi:hypothetical protein